MTKCRLTETHWSFIPAPNTELKMLRPLQPFPQHRGAGNKPSESGDQGRHLAQRRMDDGDGAGAGGVPLGEFRTKQQKHRHCS